MNTEDIRYLCTTIGNLAGIPIRIYKDNKQIFYHSVVNLPKDPILPYEDISIDHFNFSGYCSGLFRIIVLMLLLSEKMLLLVLLD